MFEVQGWIQLGPGEESRIRGGHLWIYRNEITETSGTFSDGEIVWVRDARGRKVGQGYVNLKSLISVRLLTRGAKAVFGEETFSTRLRTAIERRDHLKCDARRLVNAEADHLPGLILDVYGSVAVLQLQTLFWELRKDFVVGEVESALSPEAVVLRNDAPARKAEGLECYTEVARGSLDRGVVIEEGGLDLEVDVLSGHKTGFYIDQRENRKMVLPWVPGKRVLDCCSYTGAWSLMCARAGAARVLGVDCSRPAIDLAERNARRNDLASVTDFVVADIFDELPKLAERRVKFDAIILDPPSLAKSRKALAGAERGYIHLNKLAFGLLSPAGILVTCSCSHHISFDMFGQMLSKSAALSRKQVSVLAISGQPEDHPWLMGLPETNYLKCFLVQTL